MTAEDVGPAADLLRAGDFGDREAFFAWALEQPFVELLVAVERGRIVGTGTGSAHGRAGWVGVIFVEPAVRGRGLGRQITGRVIDGLEDRGCRTQILIASPLGRPVYERAGFVVLDRQIRFAIDGLPPEPAPTPDPSVRAFAESDREAVIELDRWATGEDRRAALDVLVEPGTTLVAIDPAGAVGGFLARAPWRGGALIANDPALAVRLLERRRRSTGPGGKAGAGVLASNEGGRAALRAAGWQEELGGVRMIRGHPLDWHAEGIFGQFNGALG